MFSTTGTEYFCREGLRDEIGEHQQHKCQNTDEHRKSLAEYLGDLGPPNRFNAMIVASGAVAVSTSRSPTRMVNRRRCGSIRAGGAPSPPACCPYRPRRGSFVSLTE